MASSDSMRTPLTSSGVSLSGPAPLLLIPSSLQYKLLFAVGKGAMGIVYAAKRTTKDSGIDSAESSTPDLAIKTPLSAKSKSTLSTLRAEATLLTYLHNFAGAEASILLFHGFDAETHSLALEYLPHTLTSLVNTSAALGAGRAAFVAATLPPLAQHLINALTFCRKASLVHGDIKPGNILLRTGPGGLSTPPTATELAACAPVLADFGAAHVTGPASPRPFSTTFAAGTYAFIPPEQLRSDAGPPSHAGDVWVGEC
ncbi:kinase-like protein [Trichodelitschia bisporula]|uniref:Kinase-like protein n=1 Tax=Trichodelitschia bisporula TaxID=703511 RepID=A0A6G1HVA3_9PEZI|nr:kinase-like protein [Trichodelitschia bisporula]